MPNEPLSAAELEALRAFDTPTICNALEVVVPERRALGFTTQTLICPFPALPPIVGYARTAMIRSALPPGLSAAEQRKARLEYYRYVAAGSGPKVVVIQDVDSRIGFGCFWGEVQTAIHKGLGCQGLDPDDPSGPRLAIRGGRRLRADPVEAPAPGTAVTAAPAGCRWLRDCALSARRPLRQGATRQREPSESPPPRPSPPRACRGRSPGYARP